MGNQIAENVLGTLGAVSDIFSLRLVDQTNYSF